MYSMHSTQIYTILQAKCTPPPAPAPAAPLESEIMDGFWSSRCLNSRFDLPNKIGSFLSDATTPMVVKLGTKKIIQLPMINYPYLSHLKSYRAESGT